MLVYEKAFSFVHEGEERELCQQDDIKYNMQGYKYEIGNRKNRIIYRGDTMNSVATTLNRYYFSFGKDALLPDAAIKHINLYHTAGNFMVLPFQYGLNINGQRGIGLSHDYFDLYLLAVYNWYMDIDGEWTLKKIFRTEANVTFLEEYLSLFKENGLPSWNVFVEKNLFQDWVSLKDGKYGMPKELWEGHFQGDVFPKTIEQFESFWMNVNENILKRGNRVYKAIHE